MIEGNLQTIALWDGEALPEGYNYLIRDIAYVGPAITHPVWRLNGTLDVSPPPNAVA